MSKPEKMTYLDVLLDGVPMANGSSMVLHVFLPNLGLSKDVASILPNWISGQPSRACCAKWDAQNEQIHHWGLPCFSVSPLNGRKSMGTSQPLSVRHGLRPEAMQLRILAEDLRSRWFFRAILTKVAKKIQKVSNKFKKCEVSNYATHNPRQQITARWWLVMADQWVCLGKIYGWNDGFSFFYPQIYGVQAEDVPSNSRKCSYPFQVWMFNKNLSQSKQSKGVEKILAPASTSSSCRPVQTSAPHLRGLLGFPRVRHPWAMLFSQDLNTSQPQRDRSWCKNKK